MMKIVLNIFLPAIVSHLLFLELKLFSYTLFRSEECREYDDENCAQYILLSLCFTIIHFKI